MAPITKWAGTVTRAADIIPLIREACQIAIDGQPGPVYLDLPEDVLSEEAEAVSVTSPKRRPDPTAGDSDVRRTIHLLRTAQRPLLCLGEGIRWSYDSEALGALVDREQLPFITAPMARGFLPDEHELSANPIRRRVQYQADLVLMVGAWFDWRFRFDAELGPIPESFTSILSKLSWERTSTWYWAFAPNPVSFFLS